MIKLWGWQKPAPPLLFRSPLRRKLLTPGRRSAYAARSKIFRRPNHFYNPSVALAVLGASAVRHSPVGPAAGQSLHQSLRPILSHLDVILAGVSR
jgi:hypothetical protein